MENKEIYIDGVDVSGCEFYLPYSEKCECIVDDNGNNNLFCREYRDCYYKRMYHTGQEKDIYKNENKELYKLLKAKEQECERLKEEIKTNGFGCFNIEMSERLDQLKAENDELKSLLKVRIEDLCDSCGASSMMPMPCKVYEKTLTEIKEVCNNNDELKGDFNLVDCDKYKLGKHNLANKILQKISECEGNDGN